MIRGAHNLIQTIIVMTAITQPLTNPTATADPTGNTSQLSTQNRIKALEAELKNIRQLQNQTWLTNQSKTAEQLQSLITQTIRNTESHTSLLSQDIEAGYQNGYVLKSSDGKFSLKIGLQEMVRFIYNDRDAMRIADGTTSGFENRRTKLFFSGNALHPDFSYKISISFSKSSGTASLSDAYARWQLTDQTAIQLGQFKPPFLYEELMSSSNQLTADRSYVNALRTLARTQGIMLDHQDDKWRLRAAINDGVIINPAGTNSKTSNTPFNASSAEFAITARTDFLIRGDWKQFKDYTSWGDDEFGLLLGAAAHWQTDAFGSSSNENQFIEYTIDAAAEFGGAEIAAALVGSYIDSNSPTTPTYNQIGGIHLVPDKIELFTRYEWFNFDNATKSTTNANFSALTTGINYYLKKQNIKFTTDIIWAFDPVPTSSTSVGLLADSPGADDQFTLRSQISLRW